MKLGDLTVRELGTYEDHLLTVVTSLAGDAMQRDRELERRGVYKRYNGIFTAYSDLSGDGVEGAAAGAAMQMIENG